MERRVVVTGMGAVSPLGLDVPSTWQGIVESRSGIGPITLFEPEGLETKFAGEVKSFDPPQYMNRKEVRRTDRFVQLAVAATQEALRNAELLITPEHSVDVGVFIGCGIGGIETLCAQNEVLRTRGPGRVSPFLVPAMITNMAAGHISIMTGARGPNLCTTSACASGAHAIGEALENIKRGWAKAIIAGGTEASITPISVAAFNSAKAISTRNDTPETASRPFDATRDGFVLSEGAAMLILEDLEFALSRGAPILAEIVSYGATADAYHITQPCQGGEGAARAMQLALSRGGVTIDEVSYINAHGTSTAAGDIAETDAIKAIFGERAKTLPVSSSKSQLGHLIGAAGAVEAVISILAIRRNLLPATINLQHPDPSCDLDYVPNNVRPAHVDTVISNSFGFGGHNAALIFRRFAE
ncbi:MAG: beta-ketoacyl-ACP synthase II [Chloroflexales bacterium]|nr:beta-ketoacyl-ACP synthase II [Chloroflexales bacterium]